LIPSFRIAIRTPALWFAAAVAALCIFLQFAGFAEALRYDRDHIDNGAWHELLTGNFVHLGRSHLWMNMAGFALIVALAWEHFNARQWFVVTIVSSLFVGVGLYLRDPHVLWYVGFSGTLHGLIVAGCLADFKHYPRSAMLLLAFVVGKLAWEQIGGALPGSEAVAGGKVLVNSHLYGAVGGAVSACALLALAKFTDKATIQTPP